MNWMLLAQLSQEAQLGVTTALLTTMAGVITTLFLWLMKSNAKTQDNLEKLAIETKADLKECREDRDVLHSKFHELAMQVAQVKRGQ
jgi:ABC-type transporter MlaC component